MIAYDSMGLVGSSAGTSQASMSSAGLAYIFNQLAGLRWPHSHVWQLARSYLKQQRCLGHESSSSRGLAQAYLYGGAGLQNGEQQDATPKA